MSSTRIAGGARAGVTARAAPDRAPCCAELEDVRVNEVFYRREPHMMRRYSALALDNIRREPVAFLRGVGVSRGARVRHRRAPTIGRRRSSSPRAARVYAAATVASVAYLILLVAGIVCALAARRSIVLPLLLILYVPATIAPVLTNMRYTVTVQPLVFVFIAGALTMFRRRRGSWRRRQHPDRADTRTAHRP